MIKKRLAFVLAMLMLFSMTACGPKEDKDVKETSPEASVEAKAEKDTDKSPIKIGGLAPLTGAVSVYGIAANNGAKLAFDEINAAGGILGRPVEFISYDEKGDATEAINAYNRLVNEDEVVALVGDVTSGPSIAVAQRAVKDGLPMISPTGTSAEITKQGPNVFRACFIDENQGDIMGSFVAENLKLKKVAIFYNVSDNYSQGLADAFTKRVEADGIEVVANESYSGGDTDFKAQLTKILDAGPELLYIPNYYNDNILIVRQARQVGLEDVVFAGGDGWDGILDENVIGEGKNDADGAFFTNHYAADDPADKVQDFLKNYRDAYDMEAVSFAALGYDAAKLLAQAIEAAGSTDKEAITKAMKEISYDGVTGTITFDDNNNPIKAVTIIEIKDGAYTLNTKMEMGK